MVTMVLCSLCEFHDTFLACDTIFESVSWGKCWVIEQMPKLCDKF